MHAKRLISIAIFLLLFFCFCASTLADTTNIKTFNAHVTNVFDGDTVLVDTIPPSPVQLKVRLANIDAPEMAQDHGPASQKTLANLVLNKDISVAFSDVDGFGRIIGTITVGGKNVNLEQVRNGLAWVYVKYGRDQTFLEAEDSAKARHIGLWSAANPVQPWKFRADSSSAPVASAAEPAPALDPGCKGKTLCSHMLNCEEALFYLNTCGVKSLDPGEGHRRKVAHPYFYSG